jgi:hypothetical protein
MILLSAAKRGVPVLRLSLQNPDGSLLITDWDAVTGEEIPLRAI